MDVLITWAGPVASVLAIASMIYTFMTAGSKANEDTLDKHEDKLVDLDRRVQSVEDEIKHLPDKDEVTDLKLAIAKLEGTVGRLEEQVGSVGRTVHRIDDYLRSEKS